MDLFSMELDVDKKNKKEKFVNTIRLFIDKIHVVNKKVCGFYLKWSGFSEKCTDIQSIISKLKPLLSEKGSEDYCIGLLKKYYNEADFGVQHSTVLWDQLFDPSHDNLCHVALVRSVIPKYAANKCSALEVILIDTCQLEAVFIAENSEILPNLDYSIRLSDEKLIIKTFNDSTPHDTLSSTKWLDGKLLPCLAKWMSQMRSNEYDGGTRSLQLVDLERYTQVHDHMKLKYSQDLIQDWPEGTDPLKYIHEDLAIASYLLVFWEKERRENNSTTKQSFADLGCGNGLLVFLLASEGHTGIGLDLRRRKIWSKFPAFVVLKECSILPNDHHLFPDYDWLIGNHSDELTPWLAVIAAKSSYNMRYMAIPCCAHDFNGKFTRRKRNISQYAEYVDYVAEIGVKCGFNIQQDKLRIPSTKRSCIMGLNRFYEEHKWKDELKKVSTLVLEKGGEAFKVRQEEQRRGISKSDKDEIVNQIGALLLQEENYIEIDCDGDLVKWNRGGCIAIRTLVQKLSDKIKLLKKENGGLLALLKSHRNVFHIEKGIVQFRVPSANESATAAPPEHLLRSKPCWFHHRHPQGCANKADICTHAH